MIHYLLPTTYYLLPTNYYLLTTNYQPMRLLSTLKNFGLTEDETNLYLAGLKTGEASMTKIAREAGINRTTAYLVAKNLEEKGLMGKFKMRRGMRFVTTEPEKLKNIAFQKAQDIESIVPELNAMVKSSIVQPEIQIFKGIEGYLATFDEPLKYKNIEVRAIGSLKKVREVVSRKHDEEHFVPTRLRRNIHFKALYFEDETTEMHLSQENKAQKRRIKFLPADYYHPVFTMIFENTVVLFTSKKELISMKITSPEISRTEKARFDLMWDLLGEEIQ